MLGERPGSANAQVGYLPQRRAFDAAYEAARASTSCGSGCDGERWGVPLPAPRWSAAGRRRHDDAARVAEAIELVGASAYADRPIGELSGGEQQRLLIAQALVQRPRLLLLDEPLDSLDLPNQAAVAALVARIVAEAGVAVLLVAHDVNPLLPYLDRVVYLAGGHAVEGTVAEVIDERDAERAVRGAGGGAASLGTGGWSSSVSPSRRLTTTTATSMRTSTTMPTEPDHYLALRPPDDESDSHLERGSRRERGARIPLHGQRPAGGHDRRGDGGAAGLVHGAARRRPSRGTRWR